MSRALSRPMSDFFKAAHEKTGVRFGFDAAVTRINGSDGRAISVEAANGEIFPADLVLVGVGVVANDELAAQADFR